MSFKDDLTEYRKRVARYDMDIAAADAILSELKAKREKILTDDIPSLLHEYGFSSATLDDGTYVEIDTVYTPKILDMEEFAQWLREHESEAIIKEEMLFEKGEVDDSLLIYLQRGGYKYRRDIGVHPQTLKAFVRRHIEEGGEALPPSLSLSVFERASIKPPRETKF